MHAPPRRAASRPGLAEDAKILTTAIRADGRHDHVTIRAAQGALYVEVDEEPIVRLEPLAPHQYGLSFHRHTGRWEPTPFTGDVGRLADVITSVFASHLESYDFPPTTNGSRH